MLSLFTTLTSLQVASASNSTELNSTTTISGSAPYVNSSSVPGADLAPPAERTFATMYIRITMSVPAGEDNAASIQTTNTTAYSTVSPTSAPLITTTLASSSNTSSTVAPSSSQHKNAGVLNSINPIIPGAVAMAAVLLL